MENCEQSVMDYWATQPESERLVVMLFSCPSRAHVKPWWLSSLLASHMLHNELRLGNRTLAVSATPFFFYLPRIQGFAIPGVCTCVTSQSAVSVWRVRSAISCKFALHLMRNCLEEVTAVHSFDVFSRTDHLTRHVKSPFAGWAISVLSLVFIFIWMLMCAADSLWRGKIVTWWLFLQHLLSFLQAITQFNLFRISNGICQHICAHLLLMALLSKLSTT